MTSKANQSQGMLLFHLSARQSFAIGTLKVKEICALHPAHRPATIPSHRAQGRQHARHHHPGDRHGNGRGLPPHQPGRRCPCFIIITDCRRTLVGFLVRGIDKITECNWRDIEPPLPLGQNVFVTGVTRVGDQLIQLLDVELILSRVYPDDPAISTPC